MRALAAVAFVAVYWLALGTREGRRMDARPVDWDVGHGPVVTALHGVLEPINIATIGLAALALIVWARRSRGDRCALRVAVALGATFAALITFGVLFDHVDPFGGETLRRLGRSSYPSGHACAVTALALVAVGLAPRRRRTRAAVCAGFVVVLVSIALVIIHAHYPSDVLGGWMLAILLTPVFSESSADI
jgi:undecaprenyl-diphosphatase